MSELGPARTFWEIIKKRGMERGWIQRTGWVPLTTFSLSMLISILGGYDTYNFYINKEVDYGLLNFLAVAAMGISDSWLKSEGITDQESLDLLAFLLSSAVQSGWFGLFFLYHSVFTLYSRYQYIEKEN